MENLKLMIGKYNMLEVYEMEFQNKTSNAQKHSKQFKHIQMGLFIDE